MDFDWTKPFLLEMKSAHIVSEQAKHGCQFDRRKASFYVHVLTERIVNIDKELIPLLPPMLNKGTSYAKPFKLNGQFMKWPGEYASRVGLERSDVGGPFSAVWYTPFDPGKTDRVKQVMLDLGWIPTEWNSKKMPFNVWSYRKRLEKTTYTNFIKNLTDRQERESYTTLVEGFMKAHFVNKSKGYMRAVLVGLGFNLTNRVPTFDNIRKKLLLNPFWPSSPKITEDSFDSLDDSQSRTLQLLRQRMVWSHRRSLIVGLIEQIRTDGKLSGELNPCATPTARGRHRIIVNIPAAGAPFGRECRSLFTGDRNKTQKARVIKKKIPEGMRLKPLTNILQEWDSKKERWEDAGHHKTYIPNGFEAFVGGDGAGLELRMLAHYLIFASKMLLEEAEKDNDESRVKYYKSALESAYAYREQILDGDIHSHNQKLAGLPSRKQAKGFIYAFLYGAGNAKLGSLVNGGSAEGEALRSRFLSECPCIPALIEWIQEFAAKNGWVPAIDGRQLIMRRDEKGKVMTHKALNTLLQAAGSIVMKIAMCILYNDNKREGLKANQVIFYHDEFQFTCPWEDVEKLRFNIDNCVRKAGLHLKMECPLASDSMLGPNWFTTH